MLVDRKHVFWQALITTFLIFILGLVVGVYFEQLRTDNSNIIFYQSEADFFDTLALIDFLDSQELSCDELNEAHVNFADRIFEEAQLVDDLENANQLTDSLQSIHKKYDLLRTILWINAIDLREKCSNVNTVVYLYVFEEEDLDKRSMQLVFSRILRDFKEEQGADVLLIPIAVDQNIASLDQLMEIYEINKFPAIVINEEHVITELTSPEELAKYLE